MPLAISCGCLAFSTPLSVLFVKKASAEIEETVGVEAMVPWWGGDPIDGATSLHYPMLISWEKWEERLFWLLSQGTPRINPSHKLGLPMVIHAPTAPSIARSLGSMFPECFGSATVWLENIETYDRATDPIAEIIAAADVLQEAGARVGVCYDIGHAALREWALGARILSPRDVERDLEKLAEAELQVSASHLHNFRPCKSGKGGDHRSLNDGDLNIKEIVEVILSVNPAAQLTLEANFVGSKVDMIRLRTWGAGRERIEAVALVNLALLQSFSRAGAQ